jgi:hypothetical protein
MTAFCTIVAALTLAMVTFAGSATAAASPHASCNGIAASSAAGQPGLVADFTRLVHAELKAAGVPPGSGDAAFAKLHSGSVEACFGL